MEADSNDQTKDSKGVLHNPMRWTCKAAPDVIWRQPNKPSSYPSKEDPNQKLLPIHVLLKATAFLHSISCFLSKSMKSSAYQ